MKKRNIFYCYAKLEVNLKPLLIYQCNSTGTFKVIQAITNYKEPFPLQSHLKLTQHFKRGLYFLIGSSIFEEVEVTIYQSQLNGEVWIRPTIEFEKKFNVI